MWGPGCSLGLPAPCSGVALCAAPQPWMMGVLSHSWVRAGDRENMESSRAPPDFSGDAVGNKAWPRTCPSPGMALSHTLRFSRNHRPCAPWGDAVPSHLVPEQKCGAGASGVGCDRDKSCPSGVPFFRERTAVGCCSPPLNPSIHLSIRPGLGWCWWPLCLGQESLEAER